MGFFSSFSFQKSILGIDIGTTSIKAVEFEKGGENPRLSNYAILESFGHFDRANDVIQANALKISTKQAGAMLKILLNSSNFKAKKAFASIPSFSSYTTFFEMPDMPEQETQQAMTFQIQKRIPLPLSELAVDWTRVGIRDDDEGFTKQQILLVAIPNETISVFKEIFSFVGLSLGGVEVEHIASSRAVIGADSTPTILVDIGSRSTNITSVDQGFVKDNNQIDYAGDSLTSALVKGLGVSYKKAEDLKRQRGIKDGEGVFELSTLQTPFLDVIINEVAKTVSEFFSKLGKKPERIVLIGGGAELIGIEDYFEKKLELPCVLGNSLLYASVPQKISLVAKDLRTRFATSIGLAVKYFMKQ